MHMCVHRRGVRSLPLLFAPTGWHKWRRSWCHLRGRRQSGAFACSHMPVALFRHAPYIVQVEFRRKMHAVCVSSTAAVFAHWSGLFAPTVWRKWRGFWSHLRRRRQSGACACSRMPVALFRHAPFIDKSKSACMCPYPVAVSPSRPFLTFGTDHARCVHSS